MNRHLTCKMIAAIVMSAFLGIFINYGYAVWVDVATTPLSLTKNTVSINTWRRPTYPSG
jgi:hypothetical protein